MSFFFISALVLPFDIRDMKQDDVVTFPRSFGLKKTKFLASLLLLTASITASVFLNGNEHIAFNVAAFISLLLVWKSTPEQPDVFYSFWVEICTALPFFFLVLLKYF